MLCSNAIRSTNTVSHLGGAAMRGSLQHRNVCSPLSMFTVRVNWLHLTANTDTILQLSTGEEQFSKKKAPIDTYEPTCCQVFVFRHGP
jgi:hypothetical protein